MTLAIFDLDNTLLGGDSDHAWGEFVTEQCIVDPEEHKRKNDQFYRDYCNGELDIYAYQRFALSPLKRLAPQQRDELHQKFMQEKIEPMRLSKAQQLVDKHRKLDHKLMVITATNKFVTEPIVKSYGIDTLLATEGEIVNGLYTGEIAGIPCFAEGKVTRLKDWIEQSGAQYQISDSYFYSDSRNDIPLLQQVAKPVAVDPDDTLRTYAEKQQWDIISLRD